MRTLYKNLLAATFLTVVATAAIAAPPASVDAGRIGRDLDKRTAPLPVTTPTDLSTTQYVEAPKGSDKITLTLKRVDVVGATALPNSKIESAYAGHIGKKITLTQVYGIANAITRIYRDNGYILSRAIVPKQAIEGGIVKIQVVEGFVSGYAIQGETYGVRNQIEAYAKKMIGSGPLTQRNLERYLLLMNDLPGVSVRAVLAPSKTTVGGADVVLVSTQKRFAGTASLDNFGNRYLGDLRGMVGGQLNSVFGSTDQLNGTLLWAPNHDELKYFSTSYRQNVGSEGTKLGFNASYTMTDPTLPNELAGTLEPEGSAWVFGFAADHPFMRSRAMNINGHAGFDITRNSTNYNPKLESIETRDDQRVLRIGGNMAFLDGFAGYNTIDLMGSKGLEIFSSSEKGDAKLSRAEGDPSFEKLTLEMTRLQRLFGPFSAYLGVNGQYSADPLLASEEFGLGGSEYGRGYDASEVTGDSGLAGKAELAYSGTVPNQYLTDYQIYTFYDIGAAWNKDPGAGIGSRQSLASAGLGTRLGLINNVRGDAYVAKPLTRDVASRGDAGDDLRFKFSLTAGF